MTCAIPECETNRSSGCWNCLFCAKALSGNPTFHPQLWLKLTITKLFMTYVADLILLKIIS